MNATQSEPTTAEGKSRRRFAVFIEELFVDIAITVVIVWGLVLLGEPLSHVLTSLLFIVLTLGGLIHLTVKALRHQPELERSQ